MFQSVPNDICGKHRTCHVFSFHERTYMVNGTVLQFVHHNGQTPSHCPNGSVKCYYKVSTQHTLENFSSSSSPSCYLFLPIPLHLHRNMRRHPFALSVLRHIPSNKPAGYPLTGFTILLLHTQSEMHPHFVPHDPPPVILCVHKYIPHAW